MPCGLDFCAVLVKFKKILRIDLAGNQDENAGGPNPFHVFISEFPGGNNFSFPFARAATFREVVLQVNFLTR